jgi:hypothetical protein
LVTVSVGRRDASCAWSFGDVAVGAVTVPAPGVGLAGAAVVPADAVTTHSPTANTRLVFIL